MKNTLCIYFFFILLPFKVCLASYEEQRESESQPISKCLRVEQIEGKPLLRPNKRKSLPYEVLVNAFDYLSFKELGTVQLVCKYWYKVAKDETLSIKYHFLNSSHACLLRKIDQNPKVQEHVKVVISNYVKRRDIVRLYYMIPNFLHKSLLVPSAIAKILRTPALIPQIFESDIKASCIYNALQQQTLDKQQQLAIESYSRLSLVRPWNETIFSEDFLNYTHLYRPYYKSYYLLALFQLPTGSPIHTLLNMIELNLESSQTYTAENEKQALWFPKAMLNIEIPPIDSYRIGYFCYNWTMNSSSSTFQRLWQRYEEMFLYNAALGKLANAQFRLGVINYHKGDYYKAELFLRQAASQAHTKAQYKLGVLFLKQGRQPEAKLLFYQAAIEGNFSAYFILAKICFHQGQLEEAKSYFRQVAENVNGKVLYNLAQLLEGNCHRPSLELFYRQIVSYTPFAEQQVLSTLLLSKNDLKQIDPFYRQVLNYGKTDIQYLLAELLNKRGSTTLAMILLEEIKAQKGS
ncbi:MAG: F-box/SEL1-like repeat protein [Alphaproteobacteria bacterium]|nr:F-box/SEL1-like repeat protein [Alphaproteobacteria bacterium]